MLKSYRVVGWVAHVILVSAQVPLVLTLDFGLGLDNIYIVTNYLATHCSSISVKEIFSMENVTQVELVTKARFFGR